ncbi:MAG TPA: flagellar basal body rod protein FlgC [Feifaniaceae bacterium]|nr:flagellar basal body rod protein FlgC [Feifaniaceae bacterium]
MAFLSSLDISGSALTAQRLRMDVISQNIANANTTRAENGEAYRRRAVVFSERPGTARFSAFLNRAQEEQRDQVAGRGVVVSSIETDMSDFKIEYDPSHPDADEDGYVRYPNVNEVTEMVDMMAATRAYEASITALNATKNMALKALEIGR